MESSGARIVVFATSGEITLTSEIRSVPDNITIAGQTAPGDGVWVSGGGLWLDNTENVIIRHMRIMVGDSPSNPNSRDSARSGDNQIWDHNTILWSTDENFDVFGDDVTMQYNIISEALRSAGHGDGNHSRGWMIGSGGNQVNRGTFFRNLLTDTDGRTPIIYDCKDCDFINNITYNGGDWVIWNNRNRTNGIEMNFYGNYFLIGPNFDRSKAWRKISAFGKNPPGTIWFYGNCDSADRPNDTGSQLAGMSGGGAYTMLTSVGQRLSGPTYAEEGDCLDALNDVPQQAGASVPTRLADVEERIESHVVNRLGGTGIVDLADVAGLSPSISVVSGGTDTDSDGIPDSYEDSCSLNKNSSADATLIASNGYSNLENYINDIAGDDVPNWCTGGGGDPDPPTPSDFASGAQYIILKRRR